MAKEAYYFSHDSNARDDEKILELRMDHDWYGYGLYWAIVEMLREANSYVLETNYKRIAFALKANEEIVNDIINNYNLFVIEDGFFYSESLKTRMKIKEEKSNKARKAALKRWGKNDDIKEYKVIDNQEVNANALQTECSPNAIKGKESKVNIYYKSESEFLEDWKKAREKLEGLKTNINKLTFEESQNFKSLVDEFSVKQFQDAIVGLFKQKDIFPAVKLRPNHFLRDRNIEKYLDCKVNNKQLFKAKTGSL